MNESPVLENLTQFWARTGSFIFDSLPHEGPLMTNGALPQKVSASGGFEPFAGSTAVFTLPKDIKARLAVMRDALYENCRDILSERLTEETFHITLHDLVSGKPCPELKERVRGAQGRALDAVRAIAGSGVSVRVESTRVFNMVNNSLVLGFAPSDEESCRVLMGCYEALQDVVRLGYPLTPHVTLAYFRPGIVSGEALSRLREAVDRTERMEKIRLELPLSRLEYQLFSDMNSYVSDKV